MSGRPDGLMVSSNCYMLSIDLYIFTFPARYYLFHHQCRFSASQHERTCVWILQNVVLYDIHCMGFFLVHVEWTVFRQSWSHFLVGIQGQVPGRCYWYLVMWNTGIFNFVEKSFHNFIPRIFFLCFVKHGEKNEKLLKELKFTYLYVQM